MTEYQDDAALEGAEDTGRHHLYRARADAAVAINIQNRMWVTALDRKREGCVVGEHRGDYYNIFGWIPAANLIAREAAA